MFRTVRQKKTKDVYNFLYMTENVLNCKGIGWEGEGGANNQIQIFNRITLQKEEKGIPLQDCVNLLFNIVNISLFN